MKEFILENLVTISFGSAAVFVALVTASFWYKYHIVKHVDKEQDLTIYRLIN